MDWVWAAGMVGATGSEGGHDVTGLLLTVLVIFVAAKIGAEIFERLKQPAVVGEILAGVIVGPQVLHWVEPSEVTFALSELGVIFLLFMVGLETKPSDLLAVGRQALLVAVGGVVLPMVLGYFFALHYGTTQVTALFIGAALVATSVGITARVLARMGYLHTRTARIILGAAVIDDILGLLVLAVVSGFARTGAADIRQIVLTGFYAVSFVLFMLFFGCRVMARALPAIDRLRIGQSVYLGAIGLCLTLSVVAGYL
ncbi:MAG TPA: cation:proton antiporter, partial [Armatimonadota bacterium]|nr:cation:proton antiporter [Armatimonadota bacterium]